ncbi:Canalicular multispecific organic anion transporter 2 [Hypsibius exemplaris]|uniref:ABC-type glutathione-S-conjugate transporter n=1 Tax=Hypsibius exemplaris TaxID=2072580 RepID=A0A9X6NCB9_HYPEX|nr:Canalicular multispecific organic anion transporter 2 [Hypsibius exemplaris]
MARNNTVLSFSARFCPDTFWDTSVTWYTDNPDFSVCFQQDCPDMAALWYPLANGTFHIYQMRHSKYRVKRWTWLSLTKILLSTFLAVVSLAEFFYVTDVWRREGVDGFSDVDLITPIIKAATYMLASWGVSQGFVFSIQTLSFPVVVAQFVLSCIAEKFRELVADCANPSPELLTSVSGQSVFSFFDSMAYLGWKKTLTQKDLWDLTPEDRVKTLWDRLQKFWQRELGNSTRSSKRRSPSLTYAIVRTFLWPILLMVFYRLVNDIVTFTAPQILRLIIDFIADPTEESWKGYFYAFLMLFTATLLTFAQSHYFFVASRLGMQIRAAIVASVYRKSLLITSAEKRTSNLGEIVNLILPISLYFLWDVLGVAVFAGLAVLFFTMPLTWFLAKLNKTIQVGQMKYKDSRIRAITEVLNGIKVLKLYAWEESFEKQILAVREKELRQLQKGAQLEAVSAFNWFATPFLVSFCAFAVFVFSPDNVFTAEKAFVALSLLNILRHPLMMLPHTITILIQSRVSIMRLSGFLKKEELDPSNVRILSNEPGTPAIQVTDATLSWGREEPVCLKNVNLKIKEGELCAVVGQVGAGKSSLVAAMLGLMEKLSGEVGVKGTVAYVPQQAWIQNMTLRDNILFGKPYEKERYDKVLEACAMGPDLDMLDAGDQTEIGEKGANLSGGQRQRVSLARAVYSDADVYFLDDPLSAVDAHVGKHIFEHVVGPNGLLKGKTRVLVTHGISFLPQTDQIVVISLGSVSEVGSYNQLLENNGAFAEFLRTYQLDETEARKAEELSQQTVVETMQDEAMQELALLQPPSTVRERTVSSASKMSNRSTRKIRDVFRQDSKLSTRTPSVLEVKDKGHATALEEPVKGRLVEDEMTAIGKVAWSAYDTYFRNASYKAVFGMVLSYFAFNAFNVGGSFWLITWTADSKDPNLRNDTSQKAYRLGIYGLFGGIQALFTLVSYSILVYGQIMASRNLHKKLLLRIMRAPMSFFDTTPLGRIVNRFSKDVEVVDSMLPMNSESLVYCFLSVAFTLFVICINTWQFAPVIVPLGIVYWLIQRFFIATSLQLKRLDSVSRSPIYSHFQESVQGSSVIMASKQGLRFVLNNEDRVNINNKPFFLYQLSHRWVAIRLDFIGNFITFFAALFAVMSRDQGWGITPDEAGMSVSYALSVTQVLNWMVRNVSEMESNIVSVERINEYSEVENEAPWVIEGARPDKEWPQAGQITFKEYQTRYRKELDLVLKGVECKIVSGEKIGIVGRTGAGKSSLTLALFRIIEAAGGSIVIDGVDISQLGLHDVRSRITILPQEPVLFSGSLRMNLDPFERYSEEEIWRALENSHLKHYVSALPDGLAHQVAEGGENLSVGQRQLICLARALLRKTKVLVLDEATAAIDLETDALIQDTIRVNFADCTILTIAHRINTIMDSTRIMVLDAGRVKEFDTPANLLANTRSIFFSLARRLRLYCVADSSEETAVQSCQVHPHLSIEEAGLVSHFKDTSVTWYTDNPDFSVCFQQTVLTWLPCGILWLMAPFHIYQMRHSKYRVKRWTWVSLTKILLSTFLAVVSLAEFFCITDVWRREGVNGFSDVDLITPIIKAATYMLASWYLYGDKRRASPSSGTLTVFWFFMLIESALSFRTRVTLATKEGVSQGFVFSIQTLSFPVVVAQFVLSCIAEKFRELVADCANPSPELLTSVSGQSVFSFFERKDSSSKRRSPSLTYAIVRTFLWPILLMVFYRLVNDIVTFTAPQILRLIIDFIADPTEESWKGYFYALLLLFTATLLTFAQSHYFFVASRLGMQIRAAIIASVYRKSLLITSAEKRSSNLGEIVNLMSVDAERLSDLMMYVNLIWSAPLQIAISLYFLWDVLGVAVFAGVAVLVLTMPLNWFLAKRNKTIQLGQMKYKDSRIGAITEVLNGIKVLKLYAWEESFEKQILAVREKELRQLQKGARLGAVSAFNWFVTPFLVSLCAFAVFVFSPDNIFTAEKAFVALSLLNILRHPLEILPHTITIIIQSRVSIMRLSEFLKKEELDPNNVRSLPNEPGTPAIQVTDATLSWGREEPVCLKNVNLKIKEGELCAVVGQVGAGKSSLVAAMLGLMEKLSGEVGVKGKVAYVPQQAWIQNMTLRDNILFGKPYEKERYDKVVEACAMGPDLDMLDAGDQTEIGEKGANLSGGQRQRVSLARAVYSDADVYFLDDPLSAVDAHVGKHIFEHVVGPNGLLKGKTRVLVTHGISFLPQTDQIVVLSLGSVSEVGSYDQLLQNDGAFAEFLRTYLLDETEAREEEEPVVETMQDEAMQELALSQPPAQAANEPSPPHRKYPTDLLAKSVNGKGHTTAFQEPVKGRLVEDEMTAVGKVAWSVYDTYFRNASYKAVFGMVFFYFASNAFNVGGSFWLTAWTADSKDPNLRNDTSQRDYRLGIYGLFGGIQALFILVSYFILAYAQIMASRNLHKKLLLRIMRAPMAFFDTTPLGRIVNRFSKDVEVVDSMLPFNLESLVNCFLGVTFTLVVICINTWQFAPVIVPLGIVYWLIQRFFIATSLQLKRLDSVSRSPIYSHFQESVQGSSVIMASKQGLRFVLNNEDRVNTNNKPFFLYQLSHRWMAIRLDFVGIFITFFAALFAVMSRDQGWGITPEEAGLSLSFALSVTQDLNLMVQNISEMESNIVSVERINEYSAVENEAPWVIESARPDKEWPQAGQISFKEYQTRYRKDLDVVLKGVECNIVSGEKIGIVGRTGAGKSSLALALFRIIEAAGGSIVIDGVDISQLGLHDVRSRITILPQEPVLFSGSLRMNLDPFERYSEEEIWRALENSHLKHYVSALPHGLAHQVAEGGENLSVGQRQLICLARALLRKTKVLVLDEATAAIDLETDALIQDTIRVNFADCTILTIAHRINTIMDSTRIMVLDGGKVKEFDTPANLLANTRSIFFSLARSANLI